MGFLQATKLGHGKQQTFNVEAAKNHQSKPLATLKDPDAFGPPPKNVNYHGGAAVPNKITPDRRGLGAPLSQEEVAEPQEQLQQEAEARSKPAPPPVPYRADRTGLNTTALPKPPVRRVDDGSGSPMSATSSRPGKPNLPPRLPPRQNSHPLESAPHDPPPPYTITAEQPPQQSPTSSNEGFLNRRAANRLGAAGISAPGLGISRTNSQDSNTQGAVSSGPPAGSSSSFGNLQSRFANLSTSSSSPAPPAQPPTASGGTTFAQKQAALKTASSFRNDPSSVSLADAKATASTANNFRERHGDQVAQGWKVGSGLNQKYGIADKMNAGVGASDPTPAPSARSPPPAPGSKPGSLLSSLPGAVGTAGINRKPPPPPVPMGSKPR